MNPKLICSGFLVLLLLVLFTHEPGRANPANRGQKYQPPTKDDSKELGQDGSLVERATDQEDAAISENALQRLIADLRRSLRRYPKRNKRLNSGDGCFGHKIDRIGAASGLGCPSFNSNAG